MAYTQVQSTGFPTGAATNPVTITVTATGAGNLTAVGISNKGSNAKAVSSVTDNQGNTWAKVDGVTPTALQGLEIWSPITTAGVSPTGGVTSLTVTFATAPVNSIIHFSEFYDSAGGQWKLDVSASAGNTTSTLPVTGTTATTFQAVELLLGTFSWGINTGTDTPFTGTTGWTSSALDRSAVSNGNMSKQSAYLITAATGTYSYGGTITSSRGWCGAIAAFYAAAAGAPVPPAPKRIYVIQNSIQRAAVI